jgi:hypothetical protein
MIKVRPQSALFDNHRWMVRYIKLVGLESKLVPYNKLLESQVFKLFPALGFSSRLQSSIVFGPRG